MTVSIKIDNVYIFELIQQFSFWVSPLEKYSFTFVHREAGTKALLQGSL